MDHRSKGVAKLRRVEAILENPEIYRLAELIPHPSPTSGGRKRHYPDYMLLVYEALVSVYGSARQVEAELSHRVVWAFMRRLVKDLFADDSSKHLPRRPMRRHHYLYGRDRYLQDPEVLADMARLHRQIASAQACELGLLDPQGPGSWSHPHLSRMLYADGKVVTPLFRAKPGETRTDKATGEVKQLRYDSDGALHFEGTGEAAWGTKFVIVVARAPEERARMILDVEWVPKPGGEASAAMDGFRRLSPHVPGAQGVIYDTALRGVHHQELLRELGLLPVNWVTAAVKGADKPRRKDGRRVEKSVHIEDKRIVIGGGTVKTCSLYGRGGEIGIGELTDTGEPEFIPLSRRSPVIPQSEFCARGGVPSPGCGCLSHPLPGLLPSAKGHPTFVAARSSRRAAHSSDPTRSRRRTPRCIRRRSGEPAWWRSSGVLLIAALDGFGYLQ